MTSVSRGLFILTLLLGLVTLGISGWAIFVGKVQRPLTGLTFSQADGLAASLPLDGPGFPFMLRRGSSLLPGTQPLRVLADDHPLTWMETPGDVLKAGREGYSFDRKFIAVARLPAQASGDGRRYAVEFEVEVHPALYLLLCAFVVTLLLLVKGDAPLRADWSRLGRFGKNLLMQLGPVVGVTVLLLLLG